MVFGSFFPSDGSACPENRSQKLSLKCGGEANDIGVKLGPLFFLSPLIRMEGKDLGEREEDRKRESCLMAFVDRRTGFMVRT